MKKATNTTSLGEIAQLAGVSISTVSLALQNKPMVSSATRERVHRIAKELGYVPDARLSSLMAGVRDSKSKDLLPIVWLNTSWERDAWQQYRFHTPLIEGARARALELGYKIEDFWCHEPGLTMKRLAKILYQRGVEGVIVTHPARHLRLAWDHLAGVTIGMSLLAPRLHRIIPDINFNLQLALKSLRRLGYRCIGICLVREVDTSSHYGIRATARDLYFSASGTERIPPLFHTPFTYYEMKEMDGRQNDKWRDEMIRWLKRYKPQVIVGHDNRIKEWAEAAGYRVPEDVGIVHLAVDDDVLDWAGINSRRREMGATAVDQVVSLMRNHQFGVPKTPMNISIRGSWQNGVTLAPSRKKASALK